MHLFHYCETNQQQSFANFVIQKLLQSQSDLSIINQELLSYWKCIELLKQSVPLVRLHGNFLNDVYQATHIAFFI